MAARWGERPIDRFTLLLRSRCADQPGHDPGGEMPSVQGMRVPIDCTDRRAVIRAARTQVAVHSVQISTPGVIEVLRKEHLSRCMNTTCDRQDRLVCNQKVADSIPVVSIVIQNILSIYEN